MATASITLTLALDQNEAKALKILLGSMSDSEFENFGIVAEDRQRMADIYSLLPFDEDE